MSWLSDWEYIDMMLSDNDLDFLEHKAWHDYYKEIERDEKLKEISDKLKREIKYSNLPNKNQAINIAHKIRYARSESEVDKLVNEIKKTTQKVSDSKAKSYNVNSSSIRGDVLNLDGLQVIVIIVLIIFGIFYATVYSILSVISGFFGIDNNDNITNNVVNTYEMAQVEQETTVPVDINENLNVVMQEEVYEAEERINPEGLKKISTQAIKDDINSGRTNAKDTYVGNSYIFEVKIDYIYSNNCFSTPLDNNDYAGSEIYLNSEDLVKFSKYKVGDTIKICGRIEKISLYHKIIIKNASIID